MYSTYYGALAHGCIEKESVLLRDGAHIRDVRRNFGRGMPQRKLHVAVRAGSQVIS